MSKKLTIDNKEYTIEFSIEASLYNECTEKTIGLMASIMEAQNEQDLKSIVSSMSDIPQTSLVMFYAGLMEHHGVDGDGTVTSLADAKRLVKTYFKENPDDENANFYGIMEMLLEQMGEDGFFKQIGLEQMMKEQTETPKKKTTRKAKVGEK